MSEKLDYREEELTIQEILNKVLVVDTEGNNAIAVVQADGTVI